ncbi:hypothetical protein PoB_004361200 [Plakobranchus ocellatus]|uniref:Uncharacterized protein n=1 Tax=Plakobranchus ocellatus TaxID=259542 RepID=A0AAV4BCD3_9GAST|nr:hypothetical protein PoB_004361200 [Plakobranchus ocellatus]
MYLPAVCLILGFLHQVAAPNTTRLRISRGLNFGEVTNKLDRTSSYRKFHRRDSMKLQVIIPGRVGYGSDTITVGCIINKQYDQRYHILITKYNLLGGEREMLVNVSFYGKDFGSQNTHTLDKVYLKRGKQETISYFYRINSRRPKDNYCRLYTCEVAYILPGFKILTRHTQVAIMSVDGSYC